MYLLHIVYYILGAQYSYPQTAVAPRLYSLFLWIKTGPGSGSGPHIALL